MKHLSIQLQHGECRVLIDVCRCTTVVTKRAFVWDQLSTTNWQGPDWLHVPVLVFSTQHRQQNYPCVTSQRHAFPDYRARVLRTINTNRNKSDYVYYCFMIVFFLDLIVLVVRPGSFKSPLSGARRSCRACSHNLWKLIQHSSLIDWIPALKVGRVQTQKTEHANLTIIRVDFDLCFWIFEFDFDVWLLSFPRPWLSH